MTRWARRVAVEVESIPRVCELEEDRVVGLIEIVKFVGISVDVVEFVFATAPDRVEQVVIISDDSEGFVGVVQV